MYVEGVYVQDYFPCGCGHVYLLKKTQTYTDSDGKKTITAYYECDGCQRTTSLVPYKEH